MAEPRQPFRFRLPWLSMTAAAHPVSTPEPQPSRPTPEIQAPARPTTTIPIQRAPFTPAEIAPPQPSFQVQITPRTEPQPPPSSQAATESKVASQPAAPSGADQTRAASLSQESPVTSQPTSPSRAAQTGAASVPPESQITSQLASPSRTSQTRASSMPPPESQVSSQTASPSRGTTQSLVAPRTVSPSSAAIQSTAYSAPPFPSQTAQTQPATQTSAQPQSPSQLALWSTGQTSSQPSSPMHKAAWGQPTDSAISQSLSPPKNSAPATKETSQPPLRISHPLSSVSQERETKEASPPLVSHPLSSIPQEKESKPAASLQLLQEPQLKTQIKSEIVSESQYQTQGETTFKPEIRAAQPVITVVPSSIATPGAPGAPEKPESIPITAGHPKSLTESEEKTKWDEGKKVTEELAKEAKPEDGNETARELVKAEKTDRSAEEKMPRTITELLNAAPGRERLSKELHGTKIKTEERKQEKHRILERKKPLTTSKTDEKHIKTVSSTHGKNRNFLHDQQKPDISNGETASLHKVIKEDVSKFVHKLALGHSKQPMGDRPASFIIIAGENKGAYMQLGGESAKKGGHVPIHPGYKLKPDAILEATTDGKESSKGISPRDSTTKNDQATRAYINSNIQNINNSIMLSSSVYERNPGVHLVFSHNLAEPTKPTTRTGTLEIHNAEFSVTSAEKLTHQPTVRRRYLRGSSIEPSDLDPDGMAKDIQVI